MLKCTQWSDWTFTKSIGSNPIRSDALMLLFLFCFCCCFRRSPLISMEFDKIPKKRTKSTHTSGKISNPKGHDQANRSTGMKINTCGKRSNRNVRLLGSHVGCRIRPVRAMEKRKAFFPLLSIALQWHDQFLVCLFVCSFIESLPQGFFCPFRVVVLVVLVGYCI